MTRGGVVAASIALAWLVAAGCTTSEPLPPVSLPDLSPLAESVQSQLREQYARLTRALADPGTSQAERAAAYGALGRVLMASTFNDEAAACYLHAEALAADDMRWPYFLGHVYLRTAQRARAAAAFERAATLGPRNLYPLVWLGETYLDDGRPDAALAAFQRAIALQPQSGAALFGAGRAALAQQAYADAVEYMERALAVDATASAIHYPLAMAYRALGDQPQTESHLRLRGHEFPALPDPLLQQDDEVLDSAVAYENLGIQALRNADWVSAEAAFRRALELDPDDATLRHWLGTALYAAGDAPGAQQEFLEVVRQSPDFAKAHFSLGAIYESSGRRPEAIEAFRAAVASDPSLPEARLRLADLLHAAGQLEAALAQYEAAVALDPGIAVAWSGGAQALRELGRDSEAAAWTTRAAYLSALSVRSPS